MAFAKFQKNRFRIDGDIAENHAILVHLKASIVLPKNITYHIFLVILSWQLCWQFQL